MAFTNHVAVMGDVADEPTSRYLPSGTVKCTFTLDVNITIDTIDDETLDKSTSIDVVVYGPHGEQCFNHLQKGSSVIVNGRLGQMSRDDTGKEIRKHVVIAESVDYLANIIEYGEDEGEDKDIVPF